MNGRRTEVELIQNPALGCVALWEFGKEYQSLNAEPPSLLAAFLVLPLVLHGPTRDLITGTQKGSGLGLFAAKLREEREQLMAVHVRALVLRSLTLQSVVFGIRSRFLTLDYPSATVRANAAPFKLPAFPESTKAIRPAAAKVGYWLAKAGLPQAAKQLCVEF